MKFWDFGYRPRHYFRHPFKFIQDFCRALKYAWQRLFRGWDERASWDATGYLGDLIPQLTRDLIRYGHTMPHSMFDDPFNSEGHSRIQKKEALQKWHDILEEIAVGFEASQKIGDPPDRYIAEASITSDRVWSERVLSWDKEQYRKFHRGMYLFHRYYFDLWD
jgi:hypothetical protein